MGPQNKKEITSLYLKKTMGDYYTLKSPWYWVIQAFTILYGLSIIAYGVVILNTTVTHTYFPGTVINEQYSQRYVSLAWYALFFAAMHIFMYPFVMMMITFRASYRCSIFWVALIFTLMVMSSYVIITLGRDYRFCNSPMPDQRDNLCNDKRWCCAPEVNAHEASGCPFAGGVGCEASPATPTTPFIPAINSLNDLRTDTDFLWLFWPNFVYLLADICIVSFFLGIFCVAPFPQKRSDQGPRASAPPLDEERDDDEENFVKKPPPPSIPQQEASSSSISHRIIQATAALKYTKPE